MTIILSINYYAVKYSIGLADKVSFSVALIVNENNLAYVIFKQKN